MKKISTQDKWGLVIIVILALLVAALVGFCMESVTTGTANTDVLTSQSNIQITDPTTTQPSTVTTTQTTQAPPTETTTQTTTQTATQTTAQTTTQSVVTTEKSPSDYTPEEILTAVRDGVNSLKSTTASFTATKIQTLNIQVDDLSIPWALSLVNNVVSAFTGDTEVSEFDFTNGQGYDPEDDEMTTSLEAIPPTERNFTMTDTAGLASATAEKVADGVKYTIKLIPESSTLENPRPTYHGASCDVLDFSLFELPVGEVTRADFTYSGATVSVTLDSEGKISNYYEYMPMSAIGEAQGFGLSGSGAMSGYVEEEWQIKWK